MFFYFLQDVFNSKIGNWISRCFVAVLDIWPFLYRLCTVVLNSNYNALNNAGYISAVLPLLQCFMHSVDAENFSRPNLLLKPYAALLVL